MIRHRTPRVNIIPAALLIEFDAPVNQVDWHPQFDR
jgi:hypothetical protein